MAARTHRRKAVRLTLFKHKGGVGKTTLTVNLAFALARLNKTVLLVDSDPQCNLTSYLVEASVVDKWLDESETAHGQTIWTALRPVVTAGGEIRPVSPNERADGVHLLPGDIRLADYEIGLAQSWLDCLQRKIRGFSEMTALSRLVDVSAETTKADIVLYDVGPNIGPLNRAILLDTDHFIVPAACDFFSVRALKTLGFSVRSWIRDWQVILNIAPDDVPTLLGRPTYLGYVLQRFRMYGGDIASSYRDHARQLDRESHSSIVSVLRDLDAQLAVGSPSQFKLGQVKDFASLAILAQEQGKALCDVNGGSPDLKGEAKQAFDEFAQKVLSRIQDGA